MKRTLVFDIEATDLIRNTMIPLERQPRVIEFCGVVLDESGSEVDGLEFLCNPGIPIPEEVTKITGIKDEDVRGLLRIDHWWLQLKRLIESCDRVVAHNLSYDKQVLDFESQRLGQNLQWPNDLLCTIEATHHYSGHRLSLANLHMKLFGVGVEKSHRAKDDVNTLVKCYLELIRRGDA